MPKYKFTSQTIIEAKTMDRAKEIFADINQNFIGETKCEEVKEESVYKVVDLHDPNCIYPF